jgi:hypothetical protein
LPVVDENVREYATEGTARTMWIPHIKSLIVFILYVSGIIMILNGTGGHIPFIKLKILEAHDLPAGFGLLVMGILLGALWRPRAIKTEKKIIWGETGSVKEETTTITDVRGSPP